MNADDAWWTMAAARKSCVLSTVNDGPVIAIPLPVVRPRRAQPAACGRPRPPASRGVWTKFGHVDRRRRQAAAAVVSLRPSGTMNE
jgi:hypothetical protein